MFRAVLTVLLSVMVPAGLPALQAHAATVRAGFNDQLGVPRNPTPGSPYVLGGPLNGAGQGETGWATTWTGQGTVDPAVVYEGDGAARLDPLADLSRVLLEQHTDVFAIQQRVRVSSGARLVAYTEIAAVPSELTQGAIWQFLPDGSIRVIDGMGDGCLDCPYYLAGTWQPDTWYNVTSVIDVPNQTWKFYLNGRLFRSPTPLGFRGQPAYLDRLRYLSEGSGPAYLDAVRVYLPRITSASVPEPATASLAMGGLLTLALCLSRKPVRYASVRTKPHRPTRFAANKRS